MSTNATTTATQPYARAAEPSAVAYALWDNLGRVVKGKNDPIRLAVVALLSGGHLLVEDVPGVGKTLLAKSLARSMGASTARVQGTHDLMPSELTGVSVHHPHSGEWHFHPGALFANVVVVDELNRCTPRTQAALLEAMEERQVSVDGTTRPLPDPFFVVATQNPHEHAGTFPLVEGQRDRFALVTTMGYPDRASEKGLLLGRGGVPGLDDLTAVTTAAGVSAAIAATSELHVAGAVADYVLELIAATRTHPEVVLGASTRAAMWVVRAAKAHAVLCGRDYVSPADVQAVAAPALAHRLLLVGGPDAAVAAALVGRIVEQVPVPRE
ncbi:MAG: MoxR family ATPase [Acidimicrobiia bacterium]|nr:MoxR family ATPase [Acidimicrobiia bacterium]